MQIKVYRLAAELRVSERGLIKWLQERGYHEARSHDWLSGQLAQAARRAFGARSSSWMERRERAHSAELRQLTAVGGADHRGFSAELPLPPEVLEGLKELGEPTAQPTAQPTAHAPSASAPSQAAPQLAAAPSSQGGRELSPARDLGLELQRAQRALDEQRRTYELQLQALRAQHDKALQERSVYRQKSIELEGDQSTITQAYEELSQERDALNAELSGLKQELTRTLEQGALQKEAWQARAQELEEQVQSGKRLPSQLRELGLEAFEDQVKLFQTLLSTAESATQFFSIIKMVDQSKVERLVEQWVVPTCVHPLCNQTNQLRDRLSLRVDRAKRCKVCTGELDRRWFQRMLASCERAHIKRLLLVGGEQSHPRLRALMEGQSISCRFISSQEASSIPRIQSRLGSADLLIVWPQASLNPEGPQSYLAQAPGVGCPSLELSGESADVAKMARQVLNLIQRGGGEL